MVATLGEAHDLGWSLTARCAFGTRDGMTSIRECIHSYTLAMYQTPWRDHQRRKPNIVSRLSAAREGRNPAEEH
jgi:hypothetical protein